VLAKWLDGGVKDILAGQLHRRLTGNATGNQCARAVNAAATPTTHQLPHAARFHIAHFALNKLCSQLRRKRRRKSKGKAERKGKRTKSK